MKNDIFIKRTVQEFSAEELFNEASQKELLKLSPETEITIIFQGDEITFPGFLYSLKEHFNEIHFALQITRKTNIKNFSKKVPFWIFNQLYVIPASFNIDDPDTLTCIETMKYISILLELGAPCKPLPYRDFHQAKVPVVENIFWESKVSENPKISVIIPTRNYENFLICSLRHLFDQTLTVRDYEVIVVDDGGDDQSYQKTKALLGPLSSQINFKYIYRPRAQGTEKQFQAGHCRNLGLEHSRGDWILFLDSDMLIKNDFLERFLEQSQIFDVIQCPRFHIQPSKSSQDTNLKEILPGDIYLEEKKYWGPFFESNDWMQISFGWRYTCTYCLGVRRSALQKVGGFRQVFVSYGFEDTELGYRLYKAGFKFLLWKENVFHLTPPKEKSRYYHSILRKQFLLSITGKIFFLSTLDLEVFNLFKLYMGGEPRWQQKINNFFRRWNS